MGKTSSEAKRRYNAKVYKTITVYLDKDLVEKFKEKCKIEGISQASVIKKAVEDFLKK